MEELVVAGPKKQAKAILAALQQAGVVHLEPLESAELPRYRASSTDEAERRAWEAVSARSEHALRLLGHEPTPATPSSLALAEAEAKSAALELRVSELAKERDLLEEEASAIELYQQATTALAELAGDLGHGPWLGLVPTVASTQEELALAQKSLEEALPGRFILASQPFASQLAAVVVVMKKDLEAAHNAMSRAGLAEFRLPPIFSELSLPEAALRMQARSQSLPKEQAGVRSRLGRLAGEVAGELQSLWTRAQDEVNRNLALLGLASGRFGFALSGWVPEKSKNAVVAALQSFGEQVSYSFAPADPHHEPEKVPVKLENPAWVKPFEMLIGFLNTPRYGTYDPTWMIAAFFPFWFGMVVGDIGYALLFWLLAYWLSGYVKRNQPLVVDFFGMRLAPSILADTVKILNWLVLWGVIWGFLYGEFFGTLGEHWGIFGTAHHPGLIPTLIPRMDTAATSGYLIVMSIAFGIFVVLYGVGIRAWLGIKERNFHHFWEGLGYFGGLMALTVFAIEFMNDFYNPVLNGLVYVGFAIFLISVIAGRMPLMVAELPTNGGHILSFIRIYAVGLASAILAGLATDMAVAIATNESLGIFRVLIGILVGVVVHAFILLLTTLGHILQPIRLLWVEYFTKFGFYDEAGRRYAPFRNTKEPNEELVA